MIKLSHVLIVDSSHHDMFKYTMTTTSASSLLSLHNSTPAIPSLPLLVSSSIDNPSPRYDLCAYSSSGRTSIRPARQRRMIIYDPIIFMVSILLLLNCVIEPTIAHYCKWFSTLIIIGSIHIEFINIDWYVNNDGIHSVMPGFRFFNHGMLSFQHRKIIRMKIPD